MKKIKNVLFGIVTALCLTLIVCIATNNILTKETKVNAEETAGTITSDEVEKIVTDTIAKINENAGEENKYFAEKILPLIISSGSALVMGLGIFIPSIKKNNKYKQLQGLYTKQTKEVELLQTLLTSTDVTKIESAVNAVCEKTLTKVIEKSKIGKEEFAEIKTFLELFGAKIESIKRGAENAWAKCPSAVEALTQAPSSAVLTKTQLVNENLKEVIRENFGENSEKLISKAEAVSY